MTHEQLLALVKKARKVLEHHLFDEAGEVIRDDVAEICMAIDDAVPEEGQVTVKRAELERSAA
ncbi:MAG: hypothetical protein WBE65_08550 [Steroidobacteraceae bacterium]